MVRMEHPNAAGLKGFAADRSRHRLRPGISAGLLLLMSVLVGCASAVPAANQVSPSVGQEDMVEVTESATASVLIVPDTGGPEQTISEIRISPSAIVLDRGETVQLTAVPLGHEGREYLGAELVWNTLDPRAGVVTADGRFLSAFTPGVFENAVSVTAIMNTRTGTQYFNASAQVTVLGNASSPRLSDVVIFPDRSTLLKEQIFRFRAMAFDQDGRLIPATSFVWRSNSPSLGRINPIGYLTVEGDEGTYVDAVTVTGVWEGVRVEATADVTVVSVPAAGDLLTVQALPQRFFLDPWDRLQLRAVALNGLGELVSGTVLRWSLVDSETGVINGSGVFIAGTTPGIYTEAVKVEAIVPGESGIIHAVDFASVVIRTPQATKRLAAVSVVPQVVIGPEDSRTLLIARADDESGSPAQNIEIIWETTSEEVGEIDPNGSFKMTGSPGIYPDAVKVTVRQNADGTIILISKMADVTITGSLAQVDVRPSLLTLTAGHTAHLNLISRDEYGTILTGLTAVWSVTDPAVGVIDGFGNFTAGSTPGLYENAIIAVVTQVLAKRE